MNKNKIKKYSALLAFYREWNVHSNAQDAEAESLSPVEVLV